MTAAERQRKRRQRLRQEQPKPEPTGEPAARHRIAELERYIRELEARIRELEAESVKPAPEKPQPKPERKPEPKSPGLLDVNWDNFTQYRPRYDRARFGGHEQHIVFAIRGLLQQRKWPDQVRETIIDRLLCHVGDQRSENIQRGIPRRVYRLALADLSPDRTPGNEASFIALKELDAKLPNGKRNPHSIILADDKVRTMADYRRQQEAARARKAAAKRKVK
jgi:hypothetical protein